MHVNNVSPTKQFQRFIFYKFPPLIAFTFPPKLFLTLRKKTLMNHVDCSGEKKQATPSPRSVDECTLLYSFQEEKRFQNIKKC